MGAPGSEARPAEWIALLKAWRAKIFA